MTETSETSMPPRVLEFTRVFDAPRELVFRCMIEPEKLVWEEPEFGMTTTSTFVDLGDGRTEVRIHQSDVPEMFTTDEAQAGFRSSLDRFAAYLATL